MAIQKNAKVVRCKEYETSNLEAVWADVQIGNERILFGSIYINVGAMAEIDHFDAVLERITPLHRKIVIGMDANSRSLLWDESCLFVNKNARSRKMGEALENILNKHGLMVHNNGRATYHSNEIATAPDVTLSFGIAGCSSLKWSILDDDVNSPHSALLSEIGQKKPFVPVSVIDWEKFDWPRYKSISGEALGNLNEKWSNMPSRDQPPRAG